MGTGNYSSTSWIIWSWRWYTEHFWVGCYIRYIEGCSPPTRLLDVLNVTAHPSMAVYQSPYCCGPLICQCNVPITGLTRLYVYVTVSLWPGAAVDRDIKHIGSRWSNYVRAVSEAEDEVVGEAGGNVQGRTASAGETEIPVPIVVAVQRQCRRRVERFLGHHTPQRLVHTDPGCQSADESDLWRQGGWEPHRGTSFRVGKRETSRSMLFLLLHGFKFYLSANSVVFATVSGVANNNLVDEQYVVLSKHLVAVCCSLRSAAGDCTSFIVWYWLVVSKQVSKQVYC